jgi:nicotinate phosphoribosyltransferase
MSQDISATAHHARSPGHLTLCGNAALLTDLYELTMLQSYYFQGMTQSSVFSLFVRKLPSNRNFMLACGLEDVLSYLENLRFTAEDLEYLRSLGTFRNEFLEWLRDFRFTGDVYALPEGSPFFANEPLIEVVAPIGEAQLLESYLLNQVHFQTCAASKAARVVLAAQDRGVVDFGLRRMHGTDAGMKAARAFYIAGVESTSNVLAGQTYGIPVSGTMAHSFVQAHEDEMKAFRSFSALYPETILLVDTYDTLTGIDRVIALSREMGKDFRLRGVRIDSSDLGRLASQVRDKLDAAGLYQVRVFASGSLDEYVIRDVIRHNHPIDGFGVGSKMGTVADAPYADMVYKLTSYAGRGRIKISPGKETLPDQKQVYRCEEGGRYTGDIIAEHREEHPGTPLLRKVMQNGARLPEGREELESIRERARSWIQKLPRKLFSLDPADDPYPVQVSDNLKRQQQSIAEQLRRGS